MSLPFLVRPTTVIVAGTKLQLWKSMKNYRTHCMLALLHMTGYVTYAWLSLQFDPAPRAGEPLVSRRVPDYFLVSLFTFDHRHISIYLPSRIRITLGSYISWVYERVLTTDYFYSNKSLYSHIHVQSLLSSRTWIWTVNRVYQSFSPRKSENLGSYIECASIFSRVNR